MDRLIVDRDILVEMRDGVELATDVYRPRGAEDCPTLVHRNPYNKSKGSSVAGLMVNPLDAVQRGFAVVVQDVRGRFKSGGEWVPFKNEAADGYDTVEWAAEQPWSNGRVGIFGSSYHGVTALQAVVAEPPSLEAAIAYLTGANYHDGWTYSGGAFELGFNFWWALVLAFDTVERLDLPLDERAELVNELMAMTAAPDEVVAETPLRNNPVFNHPATTYVSEWFDHPDYDDFWTAVDVTRAIEGVDIPILHVAGWYDLYLRGHFDLYEAIEASAGERARREHRFIVGPWDHEAYTTTTPDRAGDRVFGYEVAGGTALMSELTIEWFSRWLGDGSGPELPPVKYFQTGENAWRSAEQWPPDHEPIEFYLHSGGSANTRFGDGRLTRDPPHIEPPDSFEYDPADPVPSCGGRTLHPNLSEPGVQDRAALETREDILVYTSEKLTTDLAIAGPINASLYASSSAADTDFTATLVDVEPDGYCVPIAEGILRARYRDSFTDASFLTPGESYRFEINLQSRAHTFRSGHQIRLSVSSSNYPRFDRNPNLAAPIAETPIEEAIVATQNLFHTEGRPSHVTLPVR